MRSIGQATDEMRAERALVRAMLRGEPSAFDEFVARYTDGLLRYTQAHVTDRDEIHDVVQSTLVIAMEKLESFRGEGVLAAWLVGICRHEISARRRRDRVRARWAAPPPEDFDRLADRQVLGEVLEQREDAARVHSTLEMLPPPYGKVLAWKYLDGLPVRTIADRLTLSAKAAESLLTRARGAFRRTFEALATPGAEGDR